MPKNENYLEVQKGEPKKKTTWTERFVSTIKEREKKIHEAAGNYSKRK